MEPVKISAIVAMDEARTIGFRNTIPWHFSEDLKRFARFTTSHTVVMGRKTYESLPPNFRPLPNRKNIVISRSAHSIAGVEVWDSPHRFLRAAKQGDIALPSPEIWIIGGDQIYRETVQYWDEVQLTLVRGRHEGDARLVEFEESFKLIEKEEHEKFSFLHYRRG